MKKYFFGLLPIIFIGIIWFIFAHPFFFKQQTPYPSEYQVSFFGPWREYPQFAIPAKNNALSDVVDQIYPWKHFSVEELKKGNLPVWNPYSFSGTPHMANYQSAVFSPFNILFFMLPFIDAWSLLILLQPLLAGIFMYVFVRQLRVAKVASLIAVTSYMFCGFITVWMPYGTLSLAAAFLPLILLGIEKLFSKYAFWPAFFVFIGLAASFFSGHFQTSLYILCFVAAYVLFKFITTKNIAGFFWSVASVGAGLLIAALQIIPSLELYNLSVRSGLFSNSEGIPWYYLVTMFAPDFFGNPVTRNDWIGHYAEWASFIGIIPLLFVSAALFVKNNKKIIGFFFFAGILALILSLDTPLQQLLVALKIPVFSTSIPSRIIFLFSFSFAILAAFGFDYLLQEVKNKSFKRIIFPFLPAVIIFLIGVSALIIPGVLPEDKQALAIRNMLLPTALLGTVIVSIVVVFFIKKKQLLFLLPIIILFFVSFDSLRFAAKWVPFESKTFVFPDLPVIAGVKKHIGEGRIYGNNGAFFDTYYHFPAIEGYDPLFSQRYGEFLESAKTGEYTPAVRSLAVLDKRGKYTQRVLDLLGVTLIYQPISHTNQEWAFPIWEKPENFPTVYRDEYIALFKNNSAMPRVKIFTKYEVINDKKKLLERFFDESFDYRNVLLLEEDPKLTKIIDTQGKSDAKISFYSPEKVIIEVTTTQPGLLFLSDSYYPHWHVFVNKKEEKLLIADYTLRAVKIPEGVSTVEFRYR